jgi:L-ascorbate metabolism protein UlaG (beta-lactamase superfamily)
MRRDFLAVLGLCSLAVATVALADEPPIDTLATSAGELAITFIGHGTLMFDLDGTVVHVDPWSRLADDGRLPDADLILITHGHRDHLDPSAIAELRKADTTVMGPAAVIAELGFGTALANGDTATAAGIAVEAVPAYNLVHMRTSGEPYHPKGEGNGYVITFGDARVYVAGDTENVPEMKALEDIDIAFLPMNLPYTMTPEMVADAARAMQPAILYPYHYGETDPQRLVELLEGEEGVEVRIRPMR